MSAFAQIADGSGLVQRSSAEGPARPCLAGRRAGDALCRSARRACLIRRSGS